MCMEYFVFVWIFVFYCTNVARLPMFNRLLRLKWHKLNILTASAFDFKHRMTLLTPYHYATCISYLNIR